MQSSFLQSSTWESLQRSLGRAVWRVENVLLICHTTRFGFRYLYCPRPTLPQNPRNFWTSVGTIAAREQAIFLKIDPTEDFSYEMSGHPVYLSYSLQPQKTIVLDLSQSTEALINAMHEKTRYNIRLAEKKGVTVTRETVDAHTRETFLQILEDTARRDGFHTHPKKYYRALLKYSDPDFSNELFFARYRGQILALALVNFYTPSKTATYLHGASLNESRNVMAPYLLQWRIMEEAKRRGYLYYDFWGIDEKAWPGVTRFKKGFGGRIVEDPASRDIVFRPFWYRMYRTFRRIL